MAVGPPNNALGWAQAIKLYTLRRRHWKTQVPKPSRSQEYFVAVQLSTHTHLKFYKKRQYSFDQSLFNAKLWINNPPECFAFHRPVLFHFKRSYLHPFIFFFFCSHNIPINRQIVIWHSIIQLPSNNTHSHPLVAVPLLPPTPHASLCSKYTNKPRPLLLKDSARCLGVM